MLGKQAIVIGGSIGGLLTARALTEHFEQVTIVERDVLTGDCEPRKGAPQGRNVHVIFGGGIRSINQLFPGFFDELAAAGAVTCDFSRDLCWYHGGVWKARPKSNLVSYWQSRPFLEAHLLRRLKRDTNVRILDRHKVVGLCAKIDKSRITGVEVRAAEGGESPAEFLPAALVVDAAGRGSQLPKWLESFGYDAPRETTVEVNIGYASRIYAPPAGARDWQILAQYGTPPHNTRTGYIFPIEGGRWLVSAVGFFKDYPPEDDKGFLAFARSMERPDFYEAIENAEPLSPVTSFRFPANRWRRYDRLERFPAGLLAIGDSISAFNPVYGQGMSVCALEVAELNRLLARHRDGAGLADGLAKKFFRRTSKLIAIPWLLATQSDFLYPQTRGRRPLRSRPLNWYLTRVLQLCGDDETIARTFYDVLHFNKKPSALFQPRIAWSVMKRATGLKGTPREATERPAPGA